MSEIRISVSTIIVGVVVFLLGGWLATIALWQLRGRPILSTEDQLQQALAAMQQDHDRQVEALRRERDSQVAVLQARISEMQGIINTLATQLGDAQRVIGQLQDKMHLMELERAAGTAASGSSKGGKRLPVRPLLIVCGDDPNVAGADLAMLNQIGVRYTRLWLATGELVADEVRRAHEDGRPYRWGLVSAHAGEGGVQLADSVKNPQWWARNFAGFEAVLLAACTTTNVADALRDKVGFVAYFKEDVPTLDASKFVLCFMQRLNAGDDAETAFTSACDAVPAVASYADFRRRPQ